MHRISSSESKFKKGKIKMNKQDVKVGEKVTFKDDAGVHTAEVLSLEADGQVVVGSIVPAIFGNLTIKKRPVELTAE